MVDRKRVVACCVIYLEVVDFTLTVSYLYFGILFSISLCISFLVPGLG